MTERIKIWQESQDSIRGRLGFPSSFTFLKQPFHLVHLYYDWSPLIIAAFCSVVHTFNIHVLWSYPEDERYLTRQIAKWSCSWLPMHLSLFLPHDLTSASTSHEAKLQNHRDLVSQDCTEQSTKPIVAATTCIQSASDVKSTVSTSQQSSRCHIPVYHTYHTCVWHTLTVVFPHHLVA